MRDLPQLPSQGLRVPSGLYLNGGGRQILNPLRECEPLSVKSVINYGLILCNSKVTLSLFNDKCQA